MNKKAIIALLFVLVGCCSNVIFLELLVRIDPGSGNLITFSQFVFIALEGFIFTSKFYTKKPNIGLKEYLIMVVMFFLSSVCNNYAFNFNIPMPLHMIFRASSLITNMVMGIMILKKKYSLSKYISVLMITVGIIICTVISGSDVKETNTTHHLDNEVKYSAVYWWTVGIILLSVALFISAGLGIYQEVLYKKFGKHPREALFYTHLLSLPGFIFMLGNIWEHSIIYSASDPITLIAINGVNIEIPILIFYLICNVVTQYVCISSVYVLTTEYTSLTVTLIITLRKFVSLLFSILYFKNSFSLFHWVGSCLVFIGTLIFTDIIRYTSNSSKSNEKNKIL